MKLNNIIKCRIIKTVLFMGLMAAAGLWSGVSYPQAEVYPVEVYPIPVPASAMPAALQNPNAAAVPTAVPSFGPGEQYKLLQIRTNGNYDYVVIDESNKYASLIKIRNYGEEVVVPGSIDGYRIISIGIPYDSEYDDECIPKADLIRMYSEKYDEFNAPDHAYAINYIRRCVVEYDEYKIKNLKIPEGVRVINDAAFGNMYELMNIEFPESLCKIGINNFCNCVRLKELTFPGDIEIYSSFYRANLNKITVYGSFKCGIDDDWHLKGIYGSVRQFVIDKKAFDKCRLEEMSIYMCDLGIKELVIPKQTGRVKTLRLDNAIIDKLTLGNPNLKIKGDALESAFNKLEAITENVTSRYNKKTHKYTYTWKKLDCKLKGQKNDKYIREVTTRYVIYRKTGNGNYVKLKTVSSPKYASSKKLNLRILCQTTVRRYKSINSIWMF